MSHDDQTSPVVAPESLSVDETSDDDFWELRLYVAGRTPRAETALANLSRACELYLRGRYRIEVVDLLLNPSLASIDQIVALPTVVRRLPAPIKKIIGDLSIFERVAIGLELKVCEVSP